MTPGCAELALVSSPVTWVSDTVFHRVEAWIAHSLTQSINIWLAPLFWKALFWGEVRGQLY